MVEANAVVALGDGKIEIVDDWASTCCNCEVFSEFVAKSIEVFDIVVGTKEVISGDADVEVFTVDDFGEYAVVDG